MVTEAASLPSRAGGSRPEGVPAETQGTRKVTPTTHSQLLPILEGLAVTHTSPFFEYFEVSFHRTFSLCSRPLAAGRPCSGQEERMPWGWVGSGAGDLGVLFGSLALCRVPDT